MIITHFSSIPSCDQTLRPRAKLAWISGTRAASLVRGQSLKAYDNKYFPI